MSSWELLRESCPLCHEILYIIQQMTFTIACTHILADFSYFISASCVVFLEKEETEDMVSEQERVSFEANHNISTLPLKIFKGNLQKIFLNVISDTYTKITYT